MKIRKYRKLRKQIGKITKYQVCTTSGLFGRFIDSSNAKDILTSSPIRAIELYMKWYRNKYKRKNEHEKTKYIETIYQWGEIKVISNDFTWYFE